MKPDEVIPATDKLEMTFFELIKEKHYSKIKVSELIEKVGVSRTTFYRHYADIFDMYEKVSKRLVADIMSEAWPTLTVLMSIDESTIFDNFLITLDKYNDKIKLLSGKNGNGSYFFSRFLEKMFEELEAFPFKFNAEDTFKLKFTCISCMRIYLLSLLKGTPINKDILNICKRVLMISDDIKRYLYLWTAE